MHTNSCQTNTNSESLYDLRCKSMFLRSKFCIQGYPETILLTLGVLKDKLNKLQRTPHGSWVVLESFWLNEEFNRKKTSFLVHVFVSINSISLLPYAQTKSRLIIYSKLSNRKKGTCRSGGNKNSSPRFQSYDYYLTVFVPLLTYDLE